MPAQTNLKSIGRIAVLTTYGYIAIQIAFAGFLLWRNAIYRAYFDNQSGIAETDAAVWMDEISVPLSTAYVIGIVLTLIINGRWIYLAARNANLAHPGPDRISAGWAVGWYLVPIMNFFKPYQAMVQIWTASVGAVRGTGNAVPGWFGLWWGSWVVLGIADRIIGRVADGQWSDPDGLLRWNLVTAVSCLLWLIPAVLFIRIIREVTQAQFSQAEIFA